MLTSNQFDMFAEPMMGLFHDYEISVVEDIARRLKNLDFTSAAWQVQRITESGSLYKDILKQLAKLTGKSEKELQEIFKRAGVKAIAFDDKIYRQAGLIPPPLNLSPAMLRALEAGIKKTSGILSNLTMSTAITSQQAFFKAADLAYLEISTGAMDYNSAIRAAIKSVAAEGLSTIDYASGHTDKLDVAIRRAVLTGVGQTTGQLQIERADAMGNDLVAVSAHVGARNKGVGPMNHESWQGKIYSRSGTSKKYPGFIERTGYGTGEGLGGWNCVVGEIEVSGPPALVGYRRKYAGEILTLRTALGKELTITPNHPVLTSKGWVAAGLLREGDNVICRRVSDRVSSTSPNDNQRPTTIENVFSSLRKNGKSFILFGSSKDFHGDGSNSEIDIVFSDSFLRNNRNSFALHDAQEISFSGTACFPGAFVSKSALSQIGISAFHSPNSIMGFFGKCKTIFSRHSLKSFGNRIRATFSKWYSELCEIFSYCTLRYAGLSGNLIFPHAGFIHSKQIIGTDVVAPFDVRLPVSTGINLKSDQSVLNGFSGTSESIRDHISGYPGIVESDQIIFIERKSTQNSFIHVYNLETKDGWYFANDIITHNCRHSFYPYFEGQPNAYTKQELKQFKKETVTYQGREIDVYEATQIQRAIERKIRQWKRERDALAAAKLDNAFESSKVAQWQAQMRDFIKQTELLRQSVREQVQ